MALSKMIVVKAGVEFHLMIKGLQPLQLQGVFADLVVGVFSFQRVDGILNESLGFHKCRHELRLHLPDTGSQYFNKHFLIQTDLAAHITPTTICHTQVMASFIFSTLPLPVRCSPSLTH